MQTVLLIIQFLIAAALIIVVLLQRSEGGALGIGGGGGFGGLLSPRGTSNLLTRTTAILAVAFMANSMLLAILAGQAHTSASIFDRPPPATAPIEVPAPPTGGEPSVPLAE